MSSSQSDERPGQAAEAKWAERSEQAAEARRVEGSEGTGQAERLGIAELAEQAGVTPRTVRYYVAEGLLPSPSGSGQQRTYSREHLLRLRAIKRLKDAYLPLEEIRRRLEGLSLDEMQALVEPPVKSAIPPPTSALDYLSRFLPGRSSPAAEVVASAMPSVPAPAPGGVPVPSALSAPSLPAPATYVVPERDAKQSEQSEQSGQSKRAKEAKRAEQSLYAKEERTDVLASYALDPDWAAAITGTDQMDSSVWQRVTLAPGVELHYQPSDDGTRMGAITRIVRFARELLT